MEPQRTARLYYLKILRLKGDPQSLARGMTVGVAIGIIPILPLQTLTILICAPLFKGNSIAAVLAGLLVSNPLTLIPQYYICCKLGKLLYPIDLSWSRVRGTVEYMLSGSASWGEQLAALSLLGYESLAVMILGGVILAIPLALITYPLSLRLFLAIQRKRRQKHILS
ncbi:MAG TPA: DUF2062 domain-containing protein [Desulfurivibrio alkaliphilus]|uniref:DUF2062 domain-containing protein n=1 Tax=Desulfurivibrio alkaliphilus TaxID=427923 RepID=A0A7C2XNB4_9BACT|nr:DUF2062 domain-containing protein [Desulfurivibrio alkaliphilus]